MKILIAGSLSNAGGYEEELLVKELEKEYKSMKYDVDSFILPFSRDILSLPEQILAYQLIDTNCCDLLITVGYPACMLSHPNKVIYLFERVPAFNEYYDSEYGVQASYQYEKIKNTISQIEKKVFLEAKKVFCNSKLLLGDLSIYMNVEKEVLYPPALEIEKNSNLTNSNYIMIETDLLPYNRSELLITFAKCNTQYDINIFIPSENLVYYETMVKWIKSEKLGHQIKLIQQRATEEDYKNASAYVLMDYNNRRISNSIIMAMENQIPIIACKDCGASMELLVDYPLLKEIEADNIKSFKLVELNKATNQNKNSMRFNKTRFFAESLVNI
ncbi:hypothetical protein [Cellulosilyticum lentocellum]|uniref:Uncharacterized protein n=1 Tax=Cellulosilyticum lentocellum (strain ATCC 49066 / DSM 5427 / NCIMB 11756 / RHM5) TaxID=642492 RepID=F2JIL9_CELLD|nr:hypothetical protein [Cellulosilyticum lentocellum]ADZ85489.1 hypothetical protein Clole_3809 [Cellulosilyticum lentocellum DSM 5427]